MTTTSKERGAPGARAVITAASVAATLAGWSYLADSATGEPEATTPRQDGAVGTAPSPMGVEAAPSRGRAPQARRPATRTRQS